MNADLQAMYNGYLSDDRYLRPKEAAKFLGLSPHTLAIWRMKRTRNLPAPDLPFKRFGRAIRYRLGDLKAFASTRVQDSADGEVQS